MTLYQLGSTSALGRSLTFGQPQKACAVPLCYTSSMLALAEEVIAMAFHNPNPQIQKLEQRNARLRAEFFARLFRSAWRGLRKGSLRLSRRRYRRRLHRPRS
ncbi:hypothetical protein HALO32_02989 [Halomonas lysinitropha]|uniref:Uncharacterized protein n=1 Tax=Halomonas lysinitropha TaxID=2607506 RepID=A0A5K1IBJ7_9GAMM|nr:hypothetical protein HALO32_02989 [Halomonas lysinitropha]